METLAVLAMNASLAIQNHAEWSGGGPSLPARFADQFGNGFQNERTRKIALVLVSAFVAFVSAVGLVLDLGWVIAMLATSLIANAVAQLFGSLRHRRILPGTVSGIAIMVPAAVWAALSVDNELGWLAGAIGPAISIPVLVMIWLLARRIAN